MRRSCCRFTTAAGKLSNYFVGVANIPDENKKVSRGNEKVIQADVRGRPVFLGHGPQGGFLRLEGAAEKRHVPEGAGHLSRKSASGWPPWSISWSTKPHQDALRDKLQKAAFHCKNDLLTKMVREFPSLQGIMGGLYLQAAGEDAAVWKAIYGHYQPRGLADEKLDDLGAGILSIADRMDNIAGFVGKGIKISSSKDPYGIRRDANAIIKIIIDFKLALDLAPLIRLAALNFAKNDADLQQNCKTIRELLPSRLENYLKDY